MSFITHWLIETQHGFHVIFRVMPVHKDEEIRDAAALHRRMVSALLGDEHAALLTQVLRVPCTLQFKTPKSPFLCRLLLDNARTILPYPLSSVRGVLDTLAVFQRSGGKTKKQHGHEAAAELHPQRWREEVRGVPEGQRNAAAASIVGAILRRLPADLWDTAGWGGLKEWNQHNIVPLSERELRTIFLSISRRERIRRQRDWRGRDGAEHRPSRPPEMPPTFPPAADAY